MMEELKDKTGEEIIALADDYAHEEALKTVQKNLDAAKKMIEKMKNVAVDDYFNLQTNRFSEEKKDLKLDTSKQAWLAAFRLSHICDEIDCLFGNYF